MREQHTHTNTNTFTGTYVAEHNVGSWGASRYEEELPLGQAFNTVVEDTDEDPNKNWGRVPTCGSCFAKHNGECW